MMLAVFVMIGAILALSLLSISINMSAVNRVVLNTPKTIFETSVPLYVEIDDYVPYFDKEMLNNKLTSYYDDNLSKYVKSYTVDIYYYNKEDQSFCTSDSCQGVEVTVNADMVFNLTMTRTIYYEIQEGAYGS